VGLLYWPRKKRLHSWSRFGASKRNTCASQWVPFSGGKTCCE